MTDHRERVTRWPGIAGIAFATLLGSFVPSGAAVLSQQQALDKAWADELLLTSANMVPSWIAGTHHFYYGAMADGHWSLFEYDADTGARTPRGEGRDASVSPDGRRVLFLAPDGTKRSVLWIMNSDGTDRHIVGANSQVDPAAGALGAWASYHWSPDSKHFVLLRMSLNQLANLKSGGTASTVHAYPESASGDHRLSAGIAVFDAGGNSLRSWTLAQSIPDVGWLDNGTLVYCRTDGQPVMVGHAFVWTFDIASGAEKKLFGGYGRQVGYHPEASPDGARIAFIADPGEAVFTPAREDLAVYDIASHAVRVLTDGAAARGMHWSNDGRTLFYTDGLSTRRQLKAIVPGGKSVVLNEELGQTVGVSESGDDKWVAWTVEKPFEAFVIHVAPRVTDRPLAVAHTIDMRAASFGPEYGTTTGLTWTSFDGTVVDGLLTVPPDYDPHKRYPLVVQVHGGPQGGVEMTDYGWPGDGYFDALLASNGYLVLRPDYRASEQLGWYAYLRAKKAARIHADDAADIEAGVKMLIAQGHVDPARMVIIGLSYGGFTTNWVATHSNFYRAAITYEGGDYLVDWGGHSEWPEHNASLEWEMGGTPFTRMDAYMANSVMPVLRTASTPMMLVNGEHGINSPVSPLIYNSLRLRGIDAQFLYYDGEGHGIEQHANQVDYLARIMAWIGKYAPARNG